MSKKLFLAGAAALSLSMAPQAAHAYSIVYALNTNTLAGSSAVIAQSFNSLAVGSTPSGAVAGTAISNQTSTGTPPVESGSNLGPGQDYIRPTNAVGNYLAVGGNNTYTVTFSSAQQYLSFVFGSLDRFNSVRLNLADSTSVVLTGAQILLGTGVTSQSFSALGGDGQANGIVGYHMQGGAGIQSVTFSSSVDSFEIDSIAVAAPEPATWGMMLLGFGIVGSQLRRRRRAPAKALAVA